MTSIYKYSDIYIKRFAFCYWLFAENNAICWTAKSSVSYFCVGLSRRVGIIGHPFLWIPAKITREWQTQKILSNKYSNATKIYETLY